MTPIWRKKHTPSFEFFSLFFSGRRLLLNRHGEYGDNVVVPVVPREVRRRLPVGVQAAPVGAARQQERHQAGVARAGGAVQRRGEEGPGPRVRAGARVEERRRGLVVAALGRVVEARVARLVEDVDAVALGQEERDAFDVVVDC